MSLTSDGRHNQVTDLPFPNFAPRLDVEIDFRQPHARLHMSKEAMHRYGLLPQDASTIRTPSTLARESLSMPPHLGRYFFNLAIVGPETSVKLAEDLDITGFTPDFGSFVAVIGRTANCIVTFDTSIGESQESQKEVLGSLVPANREGDIHKALGVPSGYETALAATLDYLVYRKAVIALEKLDSALQIQADADRTFTHQFRALDITQAVHRTFFPKDLPALEF